MPNDNGVYAECPDCGSHLTRTDSGLFECACGQVLAPSDIYLEHDETWITRNNDLYILTLPDEENN